MASLTSGEPSGRSSYVVVEFEGKLIRMVKPYCYESDIKYRKPTGESHSTTLGAFLAVEIQTSSTPGELSEAERIYLTEAIAQGLIKVNGRVEQLDYVLKHGDVIHRMWHRHEPPTLFVPLSQIVCLETNDVVVCNKPCTLTVHPVGDYRLSSLQRVLEEERPDLGALFPVHRLDRLTSGLLVFARSSAVARRLSDAFQHQNGRRAEKTYIARVSGRFPQNFAEAASMGLPFTQVLSDSPSSPPWIQVTHGLETEDEQRGSQRVSNAGKASVSLFQFVSHDIESDSSLVKCRPVTGRTHQLRLHLSLMGFPIANDPDYGPTAETGHSSAQHTPDHMYRFANAYEDALQQASLPFSAPTDGVCVAACEMCPTCKTRAFEPIRHYGIWLHSCMIAFYKGDALEDEYRVRLPNWALELLSDESRFWAKVAHPL